MLCKREMRKVDHNEHGHNMTLQMLCLTLVFLWTNRDLTKLIPTVLLLCKRSYFY